MLQISKADYDLIRWEAERSYPNECCGILLGSIEGSQRTVSLTVTCENARRESQESRYSIDPEKVIAALKLARSRAETIVGFYHSHPDQPAKYSGTDLAEAHWFDCSYVITSVEAGRAAGTHIKPDRPSRDANRYALHRSGRLDRGCMAAGARA